MSMRHEYGRPIVIKDRSKRLLSRSAQQELLGHLSALSTGITQFPARRRAEGDEVVDLSRWHSRDVDRQGHIALIRLALRDKLEALRSTWSATPEEQDAPLGRHDEDNESDDDES